MPFRATIDFNKTVQASDRLDAVRQACLCLDRDLEEILSHINAINLSEVIVEVESVEEIDGATSADLWNPEPFGPQVEIPPHLVVRPSNLLGAGGAA